MRRARALLALAVTSVLTGGLASPAAGAEVDPSMPFDHIVVIVEQDHTYDSYFGSYVSPESREDGPSADEGVQSLADNYVLFDNYFASSPGGTLGNMLDLTTGDTHELLFSSKESLAALADLDVPTVFDRLNQRSVEWRLYDGGLSEVDERKVTSGAYTAPAAAVPSSLYRAPVLAMKRTWRDPDLTSRFVDQQQFFDDARTGTLPPFSLVLPSPSDRPGLGGAEGEIRLLSLINAVQKSSQWERTAIFVTWDDGGGQFDSAVPPVGNGLRVPLLLISPYAKQGYTSHVEHDHLSLLDLVEARFDLASLGPRPSAAPAFDDAFAVEAGPRRPIITTRGGLAPTPVGTAAQNLQTVALYAIGLTAAACVARGLASRPAAGDLMALSRRTFIGLTLTGAAGVLVPGCSPSEQEGGAPGSAVRPSALGVPTQVAASPSVLDSSAPAVQVTWDSVADAQSYDVELNGIVVARSNTTTQFDIAKGDGRTGLTGGDNSVRVRGRAGELEGPWSDVQTFTVRPAGVVRSRGFDAEDDGPIALTTGDGEPATGGGTALLVGAPFALGARGKGLSLRCTDPADTKAYKNHDILPVEACWVRLSFSPRAASADGTRVQLARINDSLGEASERLLWVTGQAITSSSVKVEVPVPNEAWVQLQLGVDADGRVELWAFDGTRETLVGTGRSALVGRTKNRVSIGNHHPSLGITFEAWIDDVAVGETRLPWLRTDDARTPAQPRALDVEDLPAKFSFVFGSCTNSNHVPATGSALGAAAEVDADFMIHLGDFGYLDSAAYSQTVNGYLASWSDLLAGASMSRLAEKPWIFMCSDHDLGGNNIVGATAAPFAADAFARFNANDTSVEPDGRYGSVTMDDGRVLLIWTEGVLYRSSLDDPSAPGNTKLGAEQKAWLVDLLESTDAKLVIIATETTFAHESKTSWSNHPQERAEVLAAAAATPAQVRFLSGDLHRARWARLASNVVEWGAAAMAEFPEGPPAPLPDVEDSALADFAGYRSRPSALDAMTLEQFNASTTFGYAEIDTDAHSARFELRASDGTVRIDERGQPMAEELSYD